MSGHRTVKAIGAAVLAAGAVLAPQAAAAAALDGASMGWPWALPFVGLLLSIATGPLLFPRIWHAHYGKIAFVWSTLTLVPLAALRGIPVAVAGLVHAMLAEYLSFIVLLFALYVVAGGILVTGNLRGTPWVNTAILGLGTLMASVIGTTGAAIILIRPLLRANAARLVNVHVVVFFIFLVANIGGALSPLGDPPLFVGFLRGVDFFWTTHHLAVATALTAGIVLVVFVAIDTWYYRKDRRIELVGEPAAPFALGIRGGINFVLIALIIGDILGSAIWKPGVTFEVYGTRLALENLARDGALVVIALASVALTREEHREANGFSWEPIREVAYLFAGIFACIIPVLAMLAAGDSGPFAWLLDAVTLRGGAPNDTAYFWLTGVLSGLLDNAPTYLVFFELAGGDAGRLMGELSSTLAAISMGAVFMGALTYIGNAPNFMIYAIATERGIKMPSFFGYMLWSCAVLLPVFVLLTFVSVGRP
ncbi:MAG TPA: sodium:proton antiporter [Xanthobacteraceae bacterium]|nr:sodium:proton antiporter [Xanthobacteraceae bacterium]